MHFPVKELWHNNEKMLVYITWCYFRRGPLSSINYINYLVIGSKVPHNQHCLTQGESRRFDWKHFNTVAHFKLNKQKPKKYSFLEPKGSLSKSRLSSSLSKEPSQNILKSWTEQVTLYKVVKALTMIVIPFSNSTGSHLSYHVLATSDSAEHSHTLLIQNLQD